MSPGLRNPIGIVLTSSLIAIAALAIGCGGDEDTAEAEGDFEDAQLEFAQCMRENGVDFPDPEPGQQGFRFERGEGPDLDSDAFQAAREECEPLIEDAIPEGERPDPAEIQDQLHELTECLRDKGYDVPEPRIVTPGQEDQGPPEGAQELRGELERLEDDPEFQQAREECSEQAGLDPQGGPGGGPPGGADDESE